MCKGCSPDDGEVRGRRDPSQEKRKARFHKGNRASIANNVR